MSRSGKYITQPRGYKALSPQPLPPQPRLKIDNQTLQLQEKAAAGLARIDGVAYFLPNSDLICDRKYEEDSCPAA